MNDYICKIALCSQVCSNINISSYMFRLGLNNNTDHCSTSMGLRRSFQQWSIKQLETVSNWNLYSAEPEWFMHLSFLICWNKLSTFLFHRTSQACRDEEVRMEQMPLKTIAKSTGQFVQTRLFSRVLSWRRNGSRQSPCDSFLNPLCPSAVISQCILVHCQSRRRVNAIAVLREIISVAFENTHPLQKLMSTALSHFDLDK